MTEQADAATEPEGSPESSQHERTSRVPRRTLAITIGVVLVLVLVTVGFWPRIRDVLSPIDVDSRTVTAREPSSGQGPEAGSFDPLWKRSVAGLSRIERPVQSLTPLGGDHLLAIEPDRVQAYDARTGKPSWHYAQPGWSLQRAVPAEGGVVAEFVRDPEDAQSARTQVGLDPASGEVLWSKRKSWLPNSNDPEAADPRAEVLTYESDSDHVIGVRAATGDIAWRLTPRDVFDAGCDPRTGKSDTPDPSPLVLVEFYCSASGEVMSTSTLVAVEPDSGEVVWTRPHQGSYQTVAGFTLLDRLGGDGTAELLDRTGRTVHTASDCHLCTLTSDGERVVLLRDGEADQLDSVRVTVAEPGERKPRTFSVDLGRPLGTALVADGKLYYTVEMLSGGSLSPITTLAVVDLSAGTGRVAPLPALSYRVQNVLGGTLGNPASPVDVSGKRVLLGRAQAPGNGANNGNGKTPETARHTLSAFEYRASPEPVELGGVEPESWPRACDLLAGATRELTKGRRLVDEPYRTGDPAHINGLRIPEARCQVVIPDLGSINLNLLWVAESSEQAHALLPKPVDAMHEYRIQAVGRVLVEVSAGSTPQETDRLIDLIRRELPPDLAAED